MIYVTLWKFRDRNSSIFCVYFSRINVKPASPKSCVLSRDFQTQIPIKFTFFTSFSTFFSPVKRPKSREGRSSRVIWFLLENRSIFTSCSNYTRTTADFIKNIFDSSQVSEQIEIYFVFLYFAPWKDKKTILMRNDTENKLLRITVRSVFKAHFIAADEYEAWMERDPRVMIMSESSITHS